MFTARRKRAAGAAAVVTSAGLLAPAAPAQGAYVQDLHARMYGTSAYPNARGVTEYHRDHSHQLEVHVRGIKRLAGKTLRVYVHGDYLGRMRVSSYGRAHLDRHRGVPTCRRGWVVRVRTRAGTLVTAGTFRRSTHMGGHMR